MNSHNIAVIIIFCNPSTDDIIHARNMAATWNGVIVDNSVTPFTTQEYIGNMRYMCNHTNVGIAEAQNIGIKTVLKDKETTHIVFLDQDSRVPNDYPETITAEFMRIRKDEHRLVMLGPTVYNKTTQQEYKSAVHRYASSSNGFSPRQQIISSGSCTIASAFEQVGLMNKELFVDYVDFEWCWRAIAKGFVCGITSASSISHQVGKRELCIGKYKVIVSAPFRYFYQYRNYLWLCSLKYVPKHWKLSFGIKLFARLIYFPIIVKDGFKCWKYMTKGIISGLKPMKHSQEDNTNHLFF